MKKFTADELKNYNGGDGHTYVAYKGKVYDVSDSYLWESGEHQEEHVAGQDLTDELDQQAPHDSDMLQNFPVVGELAEE